MSPIAFLWLMILVSAVGVAAQVVVSTRRRRAIRMLGVELGFHFSPGDRFRLASRVAERFPVPGAAHVRVIDLLYGLRNDRYQYVFTCEYTVGVIRTKHRYAKVVAASEPRTVSRASGELDLTLATAGLSLIDQYRLLAGAVRTANETAAADSGA